MGNGPQPTPGSAPDPGGGRRGWLVAGMCFTLFMAMLDGTVLTVALP